MNYKYLKIVYVSLALLSFILMFVLDSLFLGIVFFVFAGLFVSTNLKQSNEINKGVVDSLLKAIEKFDFNADDKYLSDDYLKGIAINYDNEQIAIFSRKNPLDDFSFKTLPFSSIIESEIREDNVSVTKASKGSTVGGALVGGALAGNVGALIGGLSSNKISSEKTHKLTLLLTIDNYENPYIEINYINNPLGTPKLSPLFDEARKQITKWHKVFSLMVHKKQNNMNY